MDKVFLRCIWKGKGPRTAKTILKKKKVGGIRLHNFKTYYVTTANKTAWHWQRNRHMDQWNRRENAETNPQICPTDFQHRCKINSLKEGWTFQ